MPRAVSGIEFGKVKIYSEASLDDVLRVFKIVVKEFGYPEEGSVEDMKEEINNFGNEDEDEKEEELQGVKDESETEDSQKESAGEDSPWLKAVKEQKEKG